MVMPMNVHALPRRSFEARHVVVTHTTGALDGPLVVSLLRETPARITFLVRAGQQQAALLAPVIQEWQRRSRRRWSAAVERRIAICALPEDLADLNALATELSGADEIVQASGGASSAETAHLMLLARRLAVKRVVLLAHGLAAAAERMAAACGLPCVTLGAGPGKRPA
jgi:hypothetical protein